LREVEAESVALLCCEALNLEGADYCRGYIQNWLCPAIGYNGDAIPEKSRIVFADGALGSESDARGKHCARLRYMDDDGKNYELLRAPQSMSQKQKTRPVKLRWRIVCFEVERH
jgi:hypothetical protein